MNNIQKNFKAKSDLRDKIAAEKDTQVIAASPGEYVLPKEVVDKVGKDNLDKLVCDTTGDMPGAAKKGGLRAYAFGGGIDVNYPDVENIDMEGDNVRRPTARVVPSAAEATGTAGNYVGRDFANATLAKAPQLGLRGAASTLGTVARIASGPASLGVQAALEPTDTSLDPGENAQASSRLSSAFRSGAPAPLSSGQAPLMANQNPAAQVVTANDALRAGLGNNLYNQTAPFRANSAQVDANGAPAFVSNGTAGGPGVGLRPTGIPGVFQDGVNSFTDGRNYKGPSVIGNGSEQANINQFNANASALRDLRDAQIKALDGRSPAENLADRAQQSLYDRINQSTDSAIAGFNQNFRSGRDAAARLQENRVQQLAALDREQLGNQAKLSDSVLRNQLAAQQGAREDARFGLDAARFAREGQQQALNNQIAAQKVSTDLQQKGFDNWNTATAKLFQTPDGKVDTAKQAQFQQFVLGSDPSFANGSKNLYDLSPADQAALIAKHKDNFNLNAAANATQGRNLFGGATSNIYAGPGTQREIRFSDTQGDGSLPLRDYAYSKLPFTDNRVVQLPDGRRMLRSDAEKSVSSLDLDRLLRDQ